MAQNTIFGWVLSGPLPTENIQAFSTILSFFSEISIDEQIAKFWEVEKIHDEKLLSEEDKFCEQLFSETISRDSDGRYIVCLPFKNPMPPLGYSRDIALRQYSRMEKTLAKNPEFQTTYNQVLQEYFTLRHMKVVSSEERIVDNQICS